MEDIKKEIEKLWMNGKIPKTREMLKKLGYSVDTPSTVYDENLQNALIQFQNKYGAQHPSILDVALTKDGKTLVENGSVQQAPYGILGHGVFSVLQELAGSRGKLDGLKAEMLQQAIQKNTELARTLTEDEQWKIYTALWISSSTGFGSQAFSDAVQRYQHANSLIPADGWIAKGGPTWNNLLNPPPQAEWVWEGAQEQGQEGEEETGSSSSTTGTETSSTEEETSPEVPDYQKQEAKNLLASLRAITWLEKATLAGFGISFDNVRKSWVMEDNRGLEWTKVGNNFWIKLKEGYEVKNGQIVKKTTPAAAPSAAPSPDPATSSNTASNMPSWFEQLGNILWTWINWMQNTLTPAFVEHMEGLSQKKDPTLDDLEKLMKYYELTNTTEWNKQKAVQFAQKYLNEDNRLWEIWSQENRLKAEDIIEKWGSLVVEPAPTVPISETVSVPNAEPSEVTAVTELVTVQIGWLLVPNVPKQLETYLQKLDDSVFHDIKFDSSWKLDYVTIQEWKFSQASEFLAHILPKGSLGDLDQSKIKSIKYTKEKWLTLLSTDQEDLNVSSFVELMNLYANKASNLDVSQNTALKNIVADEALSISGLKNLKKLTFFHAPALTQAIDLSELSNTLQIITDNRYHHILWMKVGWTTINEENIWNYEYVRGGVKLKSLPSSSEITPSAPTSSPAMTPPLTVSDSVKESELKPVWDVEIEKYEGYTVLFKKGDKDAPRKIAELASFYKSHEKEFQDIKTAYGKPLTILLVNQNEWKSVIEGGLKGNTDIEWKPIFKGEQAWAWNYFDITPTLSTHFGPQKLSGLYPWMIFQSYQPSDKFDNTFSNEFFESYASSLFHNIDSLEHENQPWEEIAPLQVAGWYIDRYFEKLGNKPIDLNDLVRIINNDRVVVDSSGRTVWDFYKGADARQPLLANLYSEKTELPTTVLAVMNTVLRSKITQYKPELKDEVAKVTFSFDPANDLLKAEYTSSVRSRGTVSKSASNEDNTLDLSSPLARRIPGFTLQ